MIVCSYPHGPPLGCSVQGIGCTLTVLMLCPVLPCACVLRCLCCACCSAASMLETLYFYALAHQNDFDVCWPRGSIAETIFTPMVNRITAAGGEVSHCCVVAQLLARATLPLFSRRRLPVGP
jgi:hypothetical protein